MNSFRFGVTRRILNTVILTKSMQIKYGGHKEHLLKLLGQSIQLSNRIQQNLFRGKLMLATLTDSPWMLQIHGILMFLIINDYL